MTIIAVRPANPADLSGSAILSIDAKWAEAIRAGSLKWLVRKRVPLVSKPTHIYFHAKAPVSALIGRGIVSSIERVKSDFILRHASDLQMKPDELRDYIGPLKELGLIRFSQLEPARTSAPLAKIRKRLNYFAPQGFAFVSRSALPVVDELCGF